MATLVGDVRDQEDSALSFKPGGSHIQIDSISIEISSGEINGAGKECKHFSIRGFVLEQRKKDIRLCSPFISDGDVDNSNTSSLELPPLDVHKFKRWRCSGCLQDRNSSQGTSKEIATRNSIISQNLNLQETGSSKGLSKLFAKENGNGFTKGKRLLQDDYSQGPSKEKSISGLSNSRGASFLKSISEAVVVPFKGLDFDKARPSRKSKVVMGPPSGPSQGTSNEFAMPPPHKSRSGKSISAPKQQNVQIPKPNNVQIWQKGETSRAGTLQKRRNYAKRSVQQTDSGRDRVEIHKADENSFASNSNREALQHDVPKEGDVRVTERFNDDQVTPQLDRNEEVGSSNRFIEKVSNHSSAGRATDPECTQFAEDSCNLRLLKRPRIEIELEAGRNNMYEEEEEEDYRGLHLRRVPKIRLLSDVIAKYPTSVGEQPENIAAAKSSEQTKRPASPVASHDTSAERAMSDKPGQQSTKSVSGSWKKRRSLQDSEEHLAVSSNGGAKRSSIGSSEPENRTEVEKKSKKTAVSTPLNGGQVMDKPNKQVFYPDKEERVQGFGKKKYCPQFGENYQPATKFLQFGPDNVENAAAEGTSDYIIIGSGFKRRSTAVENCEIASTSSSTMTDYLRTSVSTENELWISGVQAGGTVVERKGGEGPSCAQQKGRVKDIDINSIPVDDKTSEPGASDDIPMDIVELLAKNQHERNREKLISLNPGVLKPQPSYYSRNGGLGRQFEPASGKQNPFNQSRNNDLFYSRFSAYATQSQGQVPGGAQYSSSIGSTAKSWNTNMGSFRPTSRGILPPVQSFNRFPPQGHPQIWPPPLYNTPHPQGSDISFNIGNPNPSFRRPVDLTPNDTIPAMQLLNLVQVAGSSRSTTTPPVNGNVEFLRKPYSPGLHFEPYNSPPTPISRHPLYNNNNEGRNFIIDQQRCPCSSALPTPQMFVASPFVRNLSSSDKKRKPTLAAKNACCLPLKTPVVHKTEICMINRNPAEILDLKVMRSFMIGPEDLRRGKPILKGRGRPRLHKT